MSSMSLPLLLAAISLANVHLDSHRSDDQLQLELCFTGQQGQLHYRLESQRLSAAGNSRALQQGRLQLDGRRQCPLRQRLNAAGRIRLELHWSLDGIPQAPLIREFEP